jgi:polar amino acid transport system permease protein
MLDYLGYLLGGLLLSLEIGLSALFLGFLLGLVFAVMRCFGSAPVSRFAATYVEVIRNTPTTVQLFIVYFGLPAINVYFSGVVAVIIALSINSGAYQAEYFRGAIESIGGGQMDAARSTGMSRLQAIRYVITPQALRLALPSWSNEAAYMPKITSVAFLVAVPELMSRAKIVAIDTFQPLQVYLVTACVYLVVITLMSQGLDRVYQKYKLRLE